jgi:predicted Na+-dependent transporter
VRAQLLVAVAPNRLLAKLSDAVAPLAVIAVILARLAPSHSLSDDSDWLLAALVLLTAIQIDPGELAQLKRRFAIILALAVGVLLADTALAWIVSRPFAGTTRDGILSLGLASTEVASVGLIGLAGGETVFALGILTVSLVASAILGPLLAGALAHTTGHGGSLAILGRFALVVLLPLALGLVIRGVRPQLKTIEDQANGLSALTVCVLLYAAVSGVSGSHELLTELLGGSIFITVASAFGIGLAYGLHARAVDPTVIVFTTGLRDFAVAATLARQAFGPGAAGVGGVYGALMLLAGALAATLLRRRESRTGSSQRA